MSVSAVHHTWLAFHFHCSVMCLFTCKLYVTNRNRGKGKWKREIRLTDPTLYWLFSRSKRARLLREYWLLSLLRDWWLLRLLRNQDSEKKMSKYNYWQKLLTVVSRCRICCKKGKLYRMGKQCILIDDNCHQILIKKSRLNSYRKKGKIFSLSLK